MSLELPDVLQTLHRTPAVMKALLGDLPEEVCLRPYAAGAFSPYNVLGHLIIGERDDWIPRLNIILKHGGAHPFDPFDHKATIEPSAGPPVNRLLDEFAELRALNLRALADLNLTAADLGRTGMHPSLGIVTARQLLCAWAAHDLHHTAQVCKGLVARFEAQVGPWRPYMGIFGTLKPPP